MAHRYRFFVVALILFGLIPAVSMVCTRDARAADSIAFADSQVGWRATFEGDINYGGRAVLWQTADGGVTWKRLAGSTPGFTSGGGYNGGLLAFATPRIGLWGRIRMRPFLRTTDGGATWGKLGLSMHELLWDFCFASKSVAWACTGIGSANDGGSILKSTDGGRTWRKKKSIHTRLGQVPAGAFDQVCSLPSGRCFVGGSGARLSGLWATSDGGGHWARRRLPAGPYAFDFPTGSVGFNVGANGAIYKTRDGGRSWARQASPTGLYLSAVTFTDALHGWAVGESGVIVRTVDGGAHWAWCDSGSSAYLLEVVFSDADHGWATGRAGDWDNWWDVLLRTTDGGVTWQEL